MPVEEREVESGNPYMDSETGRFASPDEPGSLPAPKKLSLKEKLAGKKVLEGVQQSLLNYGKTYMFEQSVPTLRNYYKHHNEFAEMMRQERNISYEDEEKVRSCNKLYREFLDKSFLTKWAKSEAILGILESGRMENMFKNDAWGDGYTGRAGRFHASNMLFGHGIKQYVRGNEENTKLEKYGCLSSKNIADFLSQGPGRASYCTDTGGWDSISDVSCCFVLNKNKLKDRTTICFADSLDDGEEGYEYCRGRGPLPKDTQKI